MSDRVKLRAVDPEVADGTYDVTVTGGVASLTAATSGGGTGVVETIVPGTGIAVDSTDPANPVVSATGGGGSVAVEDEGAEVVAAASRLNFTGAGVSVTDSGSGEVQVDIPGGGGGGGGLWTQVVDIPGVAMTGVTGMSGTWSSNGAGIRQTDASGAVKVARLDTLVTPGLLVYEAEINIFSVAGSGNTPDQRAGIVVGYDGGSSGNGGLAGRLHMANGTGDHINIEVLNVAGRFSKVYNWGSVGTWKKLRLVVGGGVASLFVDGTLIGSGGNNVQQSNNASYLGIFAGAVQAEFRNIKAWIPTLPA